MEIADQPEPPPSSFVSAESRARCPHQDSRKAETIAQPVPVRRVDGCRVLEAHHPGHRRADDVDTRRRVDGGDHRGGAGPAARLMIRTLRVERSHPAQGQFGDAGVGFLRRSCWSPCAGARSSTTDNV
jgi:hypothetical protein